MGKVTRYANAALRERATHDVEDLGVVRAALHRRFDGEADVVAEQRRDRGDPAVLAINRGRARRLERAGDLHVVGMRRMSDDREDEVVMLAPEKRHGREPLALSYGVARGGLSLPARGDPVLDAHRRAAARVRKPRHVAGRED